MGGLVAPVFGGMTTTPGVPVTNSNNGTYDFITLQFQCDHQIRGERYQVSPQDLRTLQFVGNPIDNMRGPINGRAMVKVYIRGNLISSTDPTYGYQILADPNRLQFPGSNEVFYKIVFNREVRIVRPLIEVSYLTRQDFCLKCAGTGVLNDFQPSSSGSLVRITAQSKLAQRCLKFILTSRCAFYPQFTCPIKSFIGQKFGVTITDADIASAILKALDNVKQIQTAQNTIQTLAPEETLRDITNVSVQQDQLDPTVVHVAAAVVSFTSSGANTTVTTPLNFTLQISG